MNKKLLLASALSASVLLAPIQMFAHPEGHGDEEKKAAPAKAAPAKSDHGHEHSTKVPDSVSEIVKAIEKSQERLAKTVSDKKLADAHDHAFAIRDLAKSLVAKVPEAKKKDAEVGAQKLATLATEIDKSAAAGAQKATESGVKAMASSINVLKKAIGYHP